MPTFQVKKVTVIDAHQNLPGWDMIQIPFMVLETEADI